MSNRKNHKLRLVTQLASILFSRKKQRRLFHCIYRCLVDFVKSNNLPEWQRRNQCGSDLVRVGMIGAGRFARSHLEVLCSTDHVRVVAVCSTGSEQSRQLATEFGIESVYSDLEHFLKDETCDAYFVVVPVLQMHEVAMQVLSQGKPVFLEKPAGVSSFQTQQLIDQAEKFGTYAMVGYNRRFYSVVEHALAALAGCGPIRGGILEVPEMISSWRSSGNYDSAVYDNWMFVQSSHAIDLFRFLLGNVKSVKTINVPKADCQNAAASFNSLVEFESGVSGHMMALWDVHPRWRMRIVAERGSIEFDGLETAYFCNSQNERIAVPIDQIDTEFRCGLFVQDMKFIEAVQSQTRPTVPACLLEDAFETNTLIERLFIDSVSAETLQIAS
ncbi:MAG: Gfo/Idh/MocA family oxidoreductase [Fuerstiella sp.]